MPLPTAYGTIPLGGALPEAYIPVDSVPLLGGALESGYGEVSYAVNMTAAASGSNGITVADDNDIDFGTGDFFLHWEGSLPDWTPSSTVILIWKFAVVGYVLSVRTSGVIRIQINATNYESTVATGITDTSSAVIGVSVTRSSASAAGSVVFYVNGSQLGSPVAIPAGVPATVDNTSPLYVSGTSTARSASNTISCIVGNFSPSASEMFELKNSGVPTAWRWGVQAPLYVSDFTVNADGFTGGGTMTYTGNVDGINGSDNWLQCERTSGGSTSMEARRPIAFTNSNLRKTTITIFNPSGSPISYFRINSAEGNTSGVVACPANTEVTVTVETSILSTETNFRVAACNVSGVDVSVPNGTIFYLKTITYSAIGATMALLPNTIPTSSATTWSDTSGNTGGGTLPAAGATKVTIRR